MDSAAERTSTLGTYERSHTTPLKVLIADDDIVARKLLENLLVSWGYEPVCVVDGAEAWKSLLDPEGPSLALIDWMMPELTGIEVCKRLRAHTLNRYVYSIILTSKTDKDSLVQALDAGADDYIPKPFDVQVLKVRLRAGERVVRAGLELKALNESLDRQVIERTHALEEAVRVAEHASEMKSNFLANMSHEIRTPLNGIVSYVELLLYSELSDEQREDLVTIRNCVHSLRTIINDVLDFSKIEAGRMLIQSAPMSLKNSINEICDLFDARMQESSLESVVNIDPRLPDRVLGDVVRVQQVLSNLIGNAIKFGPPGTALIVHAYPGQESEEHIEVHFAVADSGVGIPLSKQSVIFDAFSQVDASHTRQHGGTGLGLTICRQLCTLMNGEIWVQSTPGHGSTFHFTLPMAKLEASDCVKDDVRSMYPEVPSHAKRTERPRKILLAEDNIINQKALVRILEAAGHAVTSAQNGAEVLDKIKAEFFDLILMDIQMPQMGGEEAARQIMSRDDERSKTPIIALTANALERDRERYLRVGMKRVISKPVNFNELFDLIEKME